MAVLVRYPADTSTQLMSRRVVTSSNCAAHNSTFGWGRVNLATALGALLQ